MIIDANTEFEVHLLEDDERTGMKKGDILYPKGVYWNKGNLIVVGSTVVDNTTRLSFPKENVEVRISNGLHHVWTVGKHLKLYADRDEKLCSCNGSIHILNFGCH